MQGLQFRNCCADTGTTTKIAHDLNGKAGFEYRKSEASVMLCLNTAADVFNEMGGAANMKSESLLRECTGTGICSATIECGRPFNIQISQFHTGPIIVALLYVSQKLPYKAIHPGTMEREHTLSNIAWGSLFAIQTQTIFTCHQCLISARRPSPPSYISLEVVPQAAQGVGVSGSCGYFRL